MPRNNSTPNVIEIKSNEVIVIEDSNGSTIEVVSNAIVVPGLVTATGEGGAVVRDVVTHTHIDPIIDQIQNDITIERNDRIETDDILTSEIISLQVKDVDLQQEFENVRQTTTNAIVSLQVKDVDLQQQITDMNQANLDAVISLQLKDVDLQDQIDTHQTSLDSIASSVNDAEATLEDFAIQLGNRVRFDAAQSLTSSEKQQARENIGAEAIGVAQILVDGITPASIGAATAAQGSKADTALQADDLAVVAFTNDYNDLSNKPVIQPSQVNSDWNSNSGPSEILNKPNLSSVATSGSYNDLTDTPTIYQLSTTDPIGPSDTPQVGIENTVARADHVHPLPTSDQITSSVLTGLTPGSADSISSTDTVLQAFAKLQAQSAAIYNSNSGNTILQNAIYEESSILAYTGGTINGYPGMTMVFPLSAASSGTLTMSESSGGLLYIAVISGNTLPPSMPSLAITVGTNGIGVYDTSYQVASGTEVPLQWTDSGISAFIDGEWRTQSAPTISDPHVLFFKVGGGTLTPVAIAVAGLVAGGSSGGLLLQEIESRQVGDAALAGQIADKADQYALDALAQTVADVQTLVEVNQLNITEKADQADLEVIQTTLTGQGLTLLQKADWTALDALGTVVNGKATPADITAAIAALVNGAPDALNTLSELATALAGEQAQTADLLSALALRVRVDAVQSLTLAQQLQARQNINAEQAGVAAGLVAAITPASIGAATAVQGAKADTALQSADLAPVAFSGDYSALTGLPTIPGPSSSTPAAPTTSGTAGTATTAARGDHAHPLPTSAQITAAVLTGLASGSATAIAAADSILQALEKLQAQASVNAELLAPVPRKIGPSWFVSGRWYDPCHPFFLSGTTATVPAGAVQFVPMRPMDTLTVQQIGIYVSTAAAAGSKIRLGVYADNAGIPGARLYDSGNIASDSAGSKTAACTQAFTAGVQYWLALYSGASVVVYALLGTAMGQVGLTGASTAYAMSGQSGLPATGSAAVFAGVHAPRIMLQAG